MSKPNSLPCWNESNGVRDQAAALLRRLIAERTRSERRMAEAGRNDPMKVVTGRSAIENAITATRDVIRDVDDLLIHDVVPHNGTSTQPTEPVHAGAQSLR